MQNQTRTIPNNSLINSLPILVNFNDVRNLIRLLKKKAEGIPIAEITDIFLRRLFDPCKIMAYEEWGLIVNQNNLIRLSEMGLELAKQLNSEAKVYQKILRKTEPYHNALVWIAEQKKTLFTYIEILGFWRESCSSILNLRDEKKYEDTVISFFNLCHYAELGLTTIGRKSHLTRLNIEPDELKKYLANQSQGQKENSLNLNTEHSKIEHFNNGNGFSNKKATRIFISAEADSEVLFSLRPLLEISEVQTEVFLRPSGNEHLSLKDWEAMRNCTSAIIIANEENQMSCSGRNRFTDQLLSEIFSTYALFNTRVLLIWTGKNCPNLPTQGIEAICLRGKQVNWESGIKIGQIIKKFKTQN